MQRCKNQKSRRSYIEYYNITPLVSTLYLILWFSPSKKSNFHLFSAIIHCKFQLRLFFSAFLWLTQKSTIFFQNWKIFLQKTSKCDFFSDFVKYFDFFDKKYFKIRVFYEKSQNYQLLFGWSTWKLITKSDKLITKSDKLITQSAS